MELCIHESHRNILNKQTNKQAFQICTQALSIAICPELIADETSRNIQVLDFPWKEFEHIFSQLLPKASASNHPACGAA